VISSFDPSLPASEPPGSTPNPCAHLDLQHVFQELGIAA
jgi:hypothetical protein